MSDIDEKTSFPFGSTIVEILEGDILQPGVDVDAVVSTDDNYLTMGSGVAGRLRAMAGPDYIRAAQAQCPVSVGSAVATEAYRLPEHGLNVRYVLHGAVVDYDSYELSLEQVVYRATSNCLAKAEELGLESILFPAFATGSGGLPMESCARQMCTAIKGYLAQERPLKAIYVILYPLSTASAEHRARNQRFIREANSVLDVPYNPALNISQTRDFYGRDNVLEQLQEIIVGVGDDESGKRHAVVLGGPGTGKWALLDQIYYRAQRPGSPLSRGRRLVKVTFGRVHENTPASFVYQKLLRALGATEEDEDLKRQIQERYADPDLDGDRLLAFLKEYGDRLPEVVFLMDDLPRLLQMEARDSERPGDVLDFWRDLDRLQARVRFVYTARDDERYQELLRQRLEPFAASFCARVSVIRLKCVTEQERRDWIDKLYQRYLSRGATLHEHRFFEEEGGRHPYLISLAGHALFEALKRDALGGSIDPAEYTARTLAPFFQAARNSMEAPRRAFFDLLMGRSLRPEERVDLRSLARATYVEEQRRRLLPDLERGDPDALAHWQSLQREGGPRLHLHAETLDRLEARGYLVDAENPATAQFMSKSFAAYVRQFFGVGRSGEQDVRSRDVVISLLSPQPQVIRTMFRGRGARVIVAQKEVLPDVKAEFAHNLSRYINHQLSPDQYPQMGAFEDFEQVGDYILTQFATGAIKRYFQNPPMGSTILFEIDDALKEIPWELMLEAAYAGEIPFQVGRSIISQQQPSAINPPVRGEDKIPALLIADPTDDLLEARHEAQWLADRLREDDRFAEPEVLIGSERCGRLPLLQALSSGKYGLVHYSGHTRFDGYRSAWQLIDGKEITTNMLTSALQMAPPALVFSSSCESGAGGAPQPIRYEDQAFDLPGAFLQAGVEAYIGTLWEVDSTAARRFVEEFYEVFLSAGEDLSLGECLRRAKWAGKQSEEREGRINWLAFILYGDPRIGPGDLFPAMRGGED